MLQKFKNVRLSRGVSGYDFSRAVFARSTANQSALRTNFFNDLSPPDPPPVFTKDEYVLLGTSNATNQPFRIGSASLDTMAGTLNGKIGYLAVYTGRVLTPE